MIVEISICFGVMVAVIAGWPLRHDLFHVKQIPAPPPARRRFIGSGIPYVASRYRSPYLKWKDQQERNTTIVPDGRMVGVWSYPDGVLANPEFIPTAGKYLGPVTYTNYPIGQLSTYAPRQM